MNEYNFDYSNLFAEPMPFNLEAMQNVPQRSTQDPSVTNALRALGVGGDQQGDQNEMLRNMMAQWAQQMEANRAARAAELAQTPRPQEYAQAARYRQDPVGAAIADQNAQVASHSGLDWFKQANRIPELTPEEIMASQGNTAANQWMSMRGQPQGGVAGGGAPGINPDELRRLNAARASQSYNLPSGRYV
jgi:hypothetical protein